MAAWYKFFFFLNGLVVTNSLIDKPSAVRFAIARACRLLPDLAVCVILCTVVVGPAATNLSIADYFAQPQTWSYLQANVVLTLQWQLPGVFVGHPNAGVNGSLWTLPIEVFCYLVLLAAGLPGVLRHRWQDQP